jgi:hypothetical protein
MAQLFLNFALYRLVVSSTLRPLCPWKKSTLCGLQGSGKAAGFLLLCSVSGMLMTHCVVQRVLKHSILGCQLEKDGDKQQYIQCILHSRTETYTTQILILSRFTSRKRFFMCTVPQTDFSCPVRSSHS